MHFGQARLTRPAIAAMLGGPLAGPVDGYEGHDGGGGPDGGEYACSDFGVDDFGGGVGAGGHFGGGFQ